MIYISSIITSPLRKHTLLLQLVYRVILQSFKHFHLFCVPAKRFRNAVLWSGYYPKDLFVLKVCTSMYFFSQWGLLYVFYDKPLCRIKTESPPASLFCGRVSLSILHHRNFIYCIFILVAINNFYWFIYSCITCIIISSVIQVYKFIWQWGHTDSKQSVWFFY